MKEFDFTTGSIKKIILRFFFPMLVTNTLTQVYSFADMAVIGKSIGDNSVAAVGNFTTLSFFITGFIMGITNGFSVNFSHEYGKKDYLSLRKNIASSIKLSLLFSAFFTLFGILLLKPALSLMKTDEILMKECLEYGHAIFVGLIITVSYNLLSSLLRAIGDNKTPLISVIISSVINIILDLFTVYVLKLGVIGPALATVFAQLVSVIICLIKLYSLEVLRLHKKDFAAENNLIIKLLKNGIPMAVMNSITSVGCIFVQSCINSYSVAYTTAYSTGNKFLNMLMLPGITLSFTIATFTGQNFGAKKIDRIQSGVKLSVIIGILSALFLCPILLLFSHQFSKLILSGNDAVNYTSSYLSVLSIIIVLLYLLFIFRGCIQSLGKPLFPLISGLFEMIIRILFIYFGLPVFGFKASIYAEGLAWTGALAVNFIAYFCYFRHLCPRNLN